jgi:hypothetical protein
MTHLDRAGALVPAELLAESPAGSIHRAVSTVGAAFERHHLLCTYPEELLRAGLAGRGAEARRVVGQLAGLRGFGANVQVQGGPGFALSSDYVPGRSLAQVLAKVREEQVPLGVDHALTVVQGLAQAVTQMHDRNLVHGALSPHSAWVACEGAIELLDAPAGAILQAMLPRAPALRAALAGYQAPAGATALQQDLYALGAILFELLTLERLPEGAARMDALAGATLKAAQEMGDLPEALRGLLERLLLISAPFASVGEFKAALERVLYDGDHSPTTFSMAFLMHLLFREENLAESQAMLREQSARYPGAPDQPAAAPVRAAGPPPLALIAGGILVVAGLCAGVLFYVRQGNQEHRLEQQSLEARLTALRQEKLANDARLADLARQQQNQKTLEALFNQQAEQASTDEARIQAKQNLESARQKTRKLAEQAAEVSYYNQQLAARQRGLGTAP